MSEKSGAWSIPVFLVLASFLAAFSMIQHWDRSRRTLKSFLLGTAAPEAALSAGANPAAPHD